MQFLLPHYQHFTQDFLEIAEQYSLNPDKLKVEFYSPRCQAILVEQVENQSFKIHINLEEDRIISIQKITNGSARTSDSLKNKYRKYMK